MLAVTATLMTSTAASQTAAVRGTVRNEGDSASIPHTLIRLDQLSDSVWVERRQRLTSATGVFQFIGVDVGTYRIRLLRIGYLPTQSSQFTVGTEDTVRVDLDVASRPVQLATVIVRSDQGCVRGTDLDSEPAVAELWRQARLGTETRRQFENEYSFWRVLQQEVRLDRRFGGARTQNRTDSTFSIPDSAKVRAERRRARNERNGYGSGGVLTLPNEMDLLDESFLETHCFKSEIEVAGDRRELRFEPAGVRPGNRIDIRGSIWLNSQTYQVERLALEYLRGEDVVGEATLNYTDVVVAGRSLRMPSGGTAMVRPTGAASMTVRRATAIFSYRLEVVDRQP
jgi:hypothetical protein